MKGGQAIVFLDPNADSLVTRSPQGAMIPAGMGSDLDVLLSAWGVEQDDKVLADNELALRVNEPERKTHAAPWHDRRAARKS